MDEMVRVKKALKTYGVLIISLNNDTAKSVKFRMDLTDWVKRNKGSCFLGKTTKEGDRFFTEYCFVLNVQSTKLNSI
jgi:hypothetical protein